MEAPFSGRATSDAPHVVDDPRQAALLVDDDALRFFRPFLARDATVKDAAEEVGVSLDRMLYRVRTFVDAGLLRVVRERPRAGRPIKVYRSSHDAYFVPYAATPFASLQEVLRERFGDTARRIADALAAHEAAHPSGWDGYRLYRTPDGETWVVGNDAEVRDVDAVDAFATLRLRQEDAHALRDALADLLTTYARRSHDTDPDEGAASYLLQFALVPGGEDEPA